MPIQISQSTQKTDISWACTGKGRASPGHALVRDGHLLGIYALERGGHLLGMHWKGEVFADTALPFGLSKVCTSVIHSSGRRPLMDNAEVLGGALH